MTCEITIDAAAIASAVGAATKGIAREPGDVYAFDPEEEAEGAEDARERARKGRERGARVNEDRTDGKRRRVRRRVW